MYLVPGACTQTRWILFACCLGYGRVERGFAVTIFCIRFCIVGFWLCAGDRGRLRFVFNVRLGNYRLMPRRFLHSLPYPLNNPLGTYKDTLLRSLVPLLYLSDAAHRFFQCVASVLLVRQSYSGCPMTRSVPYLAM
jgi:hypothetical protein